MTERRRIYFVTGNPGKVRGPKLALEPFGIDVEQLPIDIPEIQAETAPEIAVAKAAWAYAKVGQPLFVADSALHIPALNGFPGPNVKWVTKQIGLDGYMRLLSPWPDANHRACYFEDGIACVVSPLVAPQLFVRRIEGQLASTPRGNLSPDATSIVWKLFIPDGSEKTLAEMTSEELIAHRSKTRAQYEAMARWLQSNL